MQAQPVTPSYRVVRAVGLLWFAAVFGVLLPVALACATVYESTRSTEHALNVYYRTRWFTAYAQLVTMPLFPNRRACMDQPRESARDTGEATEVHPGDTRPMGEEPDEVRDLLLYLLEKTTEMERRLERLLDDYERTQQVDRRVRSTPQRRAGCRWRPRPSNFSSPIRRT